MIIARLFILAGLIFILAACVGSPVHRTATYNRIQTSIEENNAKLLQLKIGMSQQELLTLMGPPERSEGYGKGSYWFYRTAMTSGIYGTADSDFTPVAIGKNGTVIGWGRNFYKDRKKEYEITIKQGKAEKEDD